MSTADAVQREANWLTAYNPADGLPPLLKTAGGQWDVVQAYWSPTRVYRRAGLYLIRGVLVDSRFANHRRIDRYSFTGKLYWAIGGTTVGAGMWEAEQAAFDAAVDQLVQRVRGLVGDKTHGGAFLSVAEAPDPGTITVQFEDPEAAFQRKPAELTARIVYEADDRDFTA